MSVEKDFRTACMVARVIQKRTAEDDVTRLEEAIHRAKLLIEASPLVVEEIFRKAGERGRPLLDTTVRV